MVTDYQNLIPRDFSPFMFPKCIRNVLIEVKILSFDVVEGCLGVLIKPPKALLNMPEL